MFFSLQEGNILAWTVHSSHSSQFCNTFSYIRRLCVSVKPFGKLCSSAQAASTEVIRSASHTASHLSGSLNPTCYSVRWNQSHLPPVNCSQQQKQHQTHWFRAWLHIRWSTPHNCFQPHWFFLDTAHWADK